MKNVVVIGGGHGLSTILSETKDIEEINISAIVTVADDGGSTGRLRQLYNVPAVGDIRNVLTTLSESNYLIKDLMNFRFEGDNTDVSGHSLGNLILVALIQMSGSLEGAINALSEMLNAKGKIIPSTLEKVTLYARMDDDTIVKGEANIPSYVHHISDVFYDHDVESNPMAVKAIEQADLIIYGIGSLYTSILPNLIIEGINKALNNSKAKKVYFANCMSQSNETYNYDLKDHVDALKKCNVPIDLIIKHNDIIPEDIKDKYLKTNSTEIINNGGFDVPVKECALLTFEDGLVRHDSSAIKKVIEDLL